MLILARAERRLLRYSSSLAAYYSGARCSWPLTIVLYCRAVCTLYSLVCCSRTNGISAGYVSRLSSPDRTTHPASCCFLGLEIIPCCGEYRPAKQYGSHPAVAKDKWSRLREEPAPSRRPLAMFLRWSSNTKTSPTVSGIWTPFWGY